MDATPEPHKDPKQRASVPESGSTEDSFLGGTFSQPPLLMEYVEASSAERLFDMIESALSDAAQVNEFIDISKTLSEDPAEALNECRERICEALARSLAKRASRFDDESCRALGKLLIVADYILEANATNPSSYRPRSLRNVVEECLNILKGLALDDELPSWTAPLEVVDEESSSDRIRAWGHVYCFCFNPLVAGFDLGVVQGDSVLLDGVKELVERQFEWKQRGLGPLECKNEIVIDIWGQTFALAEKLADASLVERVQHQALALRARNSDEDSRSPGPDGEPDGKEQFDPVIAKALDEVEYAALRALAACQCDLTPVALWKEILDWDLTSSRRWRLAFIALTGLDMTEIPPYLVELLEELCETSAKERKLRAQLTNTLMRFLDEGGSEQACLGVFDPVSDEFLDAANQEGVKKLFQDMLAAPRRMWSPIAVRRLRYIVGQLSSDR